MKKPETLFLLFAIAFFGMAWFAISRTNFPTVTLAAPEPPPQGNITWLSQKGNVAVQLQQFGGLDIVQFEMNGVVCTTARATGASPSQQHPSISCVKKAEKW